ncbi:hypothetical protein [Accumulibacter sp.]|jgi:hypothetical protein|uniref:hypothetical protein n=1 Tax=Accumulibacter sp. TaxID=2053492 RepID=UPI001AC4AB5E|nr:hypothetical protein [Accumulibacter sp.]MBN8452265.1 hypothetical protein [Accumulibacter sp.]
MCPISGGNWNNGSNAGVWALNLSNSRSSSNDNVGFRADSISPQGLLFGRSGIKGGAFRRAVAAFTIAAAKSVGFRLSGRPAVGRVEGQAK